MTDISNDAYLARMAIVEAAGLCAAAATSPSVLYRPALLPDGNQWCALFGPDLVVGVAGFGETPEKAMAAFDKAWREARSPHALAEGGR